MDCSRPGFAVHHQLLEPIQGDAIQPSHPLSSLLLLPSIFLSIRVFSNELVLPIRWPKYWSFSFSLSPSSEHPGLISFRMDWLDLLAVQGTLKNLLQYHTSRASTVRHSASVSVSVSLCLSLSLALSLSFSLWFSFSQPLYLNLAPLSKVPCLILGLGRSSGEGNGNHLQYSCLENSMNRGAW